MPGEAVPLTLADLSEADHAKLAAIFGAGAYVLCSSCFGGMPLPRRKPVSARVQEIGEMIRIAL